MTPKKKKKQKLVERSKFVFETSKKTYLHDRKNTILDSILSISRLMIENNVTQRYKDRLFSRDSNPENRKTFQNLSRGLGYWPSKKHCAFCTQLGHCPSFILSTDVRWSSRKPKGYLLLLLSHSLRCVECTNRQRVLLRKEILYFPDILPIIIQLIVNTIERFHELKLTRGTR